MLRRSNAIKHYQPPWDRLPEDYTEMSVVDRNILLARRERARALAARSVLLDMLSQQGADIEETNNEISELDAELFAGNAIKEFKFDPSIINNRIQAANNKLELLTTLLKRNRAELHACDSCIRRNDHLIRRLLPKSSRHEALGLQGRHQAN